MPARGASAVSPFFSFSVTGTSCSSAMGPVLARGRKGLGQVTLGSNLNTLDRLRSSASVLNPGEGEADAGWGKGSVIPNFALTASDRGVTS